MIFGQFPVLLAGLLVGGSLVGVTSAADKADKKKPETQEVQVDDLKLTIPKSWKKVTPKSRLRTGQFDIPPVKGDKNKVEYIIFHFAGGGGDVGANVTRWKDQFEAKGRKVKVTQGKTANGPYVFVDISGTYKMPVGPPIKRMTKKLPNARMLAAIIGLSEKRKVYYIRAAGEAKTVTANAEAFRKSFGGDAKKEEAYKLPGQEQ